MTQEMMPGLVRRAPSIYFRLSNQATVELEALLGGDIDLQRRPLFEVIAPATGQARASSVEELRFLANVPADDHVAVKALLEITAADASEISGMIEEGLLLPVDPSSLDPGPSPIPWGRAAYLFHLACLGEGGGSSGTSEAAAALDIDLEREHSEENAERFLREYGPPPPPSLRYRSNPETAASRTVALPFDAHLEDTFFQTLAGRRTWRHFSDESLGLKELSDLLGWTFGVQGSVRLSNKYLAPLKTSPSGGSTHPIEAYPFVLRVNGLAPGVYHYDSFAHSLTPLCLAPLEALKALLVDLSNGQKFVAEAAAAVLLNARLGRNFWKYRNSDRTFGVVLQDAGHLSQSFYLTAERLGLGAFYSASLSGTVCRETLGIDLSREAPLGVAGVGHKRAEKETWLDIQRHVPGSVPYKTDTETRRIARENLNSDRLEPAAGAIHFRNLRLSPPFEE